MIKAILFDLDNTLIDFFRFKKNSCDAAINAMILAGLKINKKKATRILFELYDRYGIEYPRIFQKFLMKVNKKIDYKILTHGIMAYRKMKENFMTPYPGTIETLKKLKKKYKLAIISDAPGINAWMRLIAMNIDTYFDVVLTKSDIKAQKPSSKIFMRVISLLKVKPSECIMIGDRIERDISGANALGIKTVFKKYGHKQTKYSGANFEIKKINELPKIIKKL